MDQEFSAFKESLEADRPFPVDEEGWLALRARLERAQRGHRRAAWPWLLACLLLLTLGGLLFTRRELQRVRQTHTLLLSRFDSLLADAPAPPRPDRTRYDTIYIERIVYRNLSPASAVGQAASVPMPAIPSRIAISPDSDFGSARLAGSAADTSTMPAAEVAALRVLPLRWGVRRPPRPLPVPELPPLIAPYHPSSFTRLARSVRPGELSLGISVGVGRPDDKGQIETHSTSSDLILALQFGPALELVGKLGLYRLKYDLRQFNSDLGVLPLDPPAEGYTFSDAQVRIPTLYWGLGGRYRFRPGSRWQPYAQLTYGRIYLQAYQTEYAFKQGAAEIPVEIERQFNPSRYPFLQPGGGIGYRFRNRPWRLGLQASLVWPLRASRLPLGAVTLNGQIEYIF